MRDGGKEKNERARTSRVFMIFLELCFRIICITLTCDITQVCVPQTRTKPTSRRSSRRPADQAGRNRKHRAGQVGRSNEAAAKPRNQTSQQENRTNNHNIEPADGPTPKTPRARSARAIDRQLVPNRAKRGRGSGGHPQKREKKREKKFKTKK